jgi:hypothetical protein
MQRRNDVDVDDGIIAEEGGEERAITLLSAPSPI